MDSNKKAKKIKYIKNQNFNKKKNKEIKIFVLATEEKSVWSNQNIIFYFKNEEKAKEFIDSINKIPDVDIKFKSLGYMLVEKTRVLQIELNRNAESYSEYIQDWALSFTKEHQTGFEFKRDKHKKAKEKDNILTIDKVYPRI